MGSFNVIDLNKIDYCENRINEIVYQLYELAEEEIKNN